MKVTKTSDQPAFRPIEIKITIESEEELHDLLVCSSLSSNIRAVLSNTCLDYDSATTLKRLLDSIGDCLQKGFKGTQKPLKSID